LKKKKNGSDSQKWLESLKELDRENNPLVLDICFRRMYSVQGGDAHRKTEHVNLIMNAKAREGRLYDIAHHFDYLKRSSLGNKLNEESYNAVAQCVLNLKEYQLADLIYRHYENSAKKFPISPNILQELKEAAGKMDYAGFAKWAYENGPKPAQAVEKAEIIKKFKENIMATMESSIQPSFDKIPTIVERDV